MKFETEVFISYAHLDNQCARQGHEWITDFHGALAVRVGQLLGKEPQIWRDPKLQGNDCFADTLLERLKHVALLVSVLSPRYIKSEWTRRELDEFCHAATETGGFAIANKARVFKVVKTPIPREMELPALQRLLGYEFFKLDPENGRPRELDDPGDKEYWTKIDDIAHDMSQLIEVLESETSEACVTPGEKRTIYLAETTFDLRPEYDTIKRDLQQHGHTVVPAQPLPLLASELTSYVRDEMAACDVSVHLVGKTYSMVPEGGMQSIAEVQNELGMERAVKGEFAQLVWVPPGLEIQDERQRAFVERLRMNPRVQDATDLLETSLEDLRTVIHEKLKPKPEAKTPSDVKPVSAKGVKQLYFMFDQQDQETISPWVNFLFEHFEVVYPMFEGDEADIREFHEENLRTSDAVLIHYGAAGEIWLRRKLRELLKSAAYGRTEPLRAVGVSVAPPMTAQKQMFKTHEATVISQCDGFKADPFLSFVDRVNQE